MRSKRAGASQRSARPSRAAGGRPEGIPRRRLGGLAVLGAVAWLALGARLVQIQGLEHAAYAEQARQQHHRWIELRAKRGTITDRHGRELALDVPATSFYCDPRRVAQADSVALHFASLSGRNAEDLRGLMRSSKPFVYLLRQADNDLADRARARSFAGVYELPETRRSHPYGRLAAQLIGFTDIDNRGREGVEAAQEESLRPRPGRALCRVDAHGRAVDGARLAQEGEAIPGRDLQLTIDAAYQGILEEELATAMASTDCETAMGIITDPRSGEILAMVSVPFFDANSPGSASAAARRNRVVTDPFEPGSTFKAIAAAAVLEEGRAVPETQLYCEEGVFELATGDTLRDLHPNGWLSMRQVLEQSSNIGALKLVARLSRPTFYSYLRRFGFGTRTGIGLPAETAGLLRNASEWSDRSLQTIAIGQEVSATALQLVQAFGTIANGGFLMPPAILKPGVDGAAVVPQPVRRVIGEKAASQMRQMLASVVEVGTGHRGAIPGVRVAGKTGTAQRAAADGSGYAPDERIASFVGFLPADQPELLCFIVLDNPQTGKWGGQVAAPVFARTMERVLALRTAANGSQSLALAQSSVYAAPDSGRTLMPDLRGLTAAMARYHCRVRGLALDLGGEGDLIVHQEPDPGTPIAQADYATCRLGLSWEIPVDGLEGIPARQAVLMRMLGARWGRSLAMVQP